MFRSFLLFFLMLFNHDDNNNNDSLSNTNCKQLYIYISTATRWFNTAIISTSITTTSYCIAIEIFTTKNENEKRGEIREII